MNIVLLDEEVKLALEEAGLFHFPAHFDFVDGSDIVYMTLVVDAEFD